MAQFDDFDFGDAKRNTGAHLSEDDQERRMTLRIREGGWLELNMLRLAQRRPVNSLITEAINDYLVKNGKPPLA
ncbi:hypothetical protein [uncultured Mediterranean phage uvMED]|nr:hypothetical protein [uncultured Mediterranean phage uvMED]|tara:strand:+ start:277 stop:498 length:222 start_codon:yes stop_codon:yes gene_type:complete